MSTPDELEMFFFVNVFTLQKKILKLPQNRLYDIELNDIQLIYNWSVPSFILVNALLPLTVGNVADTITAWQRCILTSAQPGTQNRSDFYYNTYHIEKMYFLVKIIQNYAHYTLLITREPKLRNCMLTISTNKYAKNRVFKIHRDCWW